MLKLTRIAITGGIASGKSSVCRALQKLGAFVVSADEIVHELLSPETNLGQQIIRLLGNEILVNGTLSRRVIADKVFKDPDALHALEKLLHPAVLHKIEELYKSACRQGSATAFVVESPLLYEIGQERFFDIVIAVTAEEPVCIERLRQTGLSKKEYELRMKRQWPPSFKARRADYVIENNGSFDELQSKVVDIYQKIQNH